MRRPHHIEATCTIAVASHRRALELAGRSLGTRRPDATAPLHLSPSSASLHAAERAQTSPAPLHSTTPSPAPQNPLQRLLFAKPAGEPKKTPRSSSASAIAELRLRAKFEQVTHPSSNSSCAQHLHHTTNSFEVYPSFPEPSSAGTTTNHTTSSPTTTSTRI